MRTVVLFFYLLFSLTGRVVFPGEPAYSDEKIIEYDFGLIPGESPVSKTFVFPKGIETAVSLCECVSFERKEEKGRDCLTLFFNPQGYSGKTVQEVLLVDKQGNIIRIKISAFVR